MNLKHIFFFFLVVATNLAAQNAQRSIVQSIDSLIEASKNSNLKSEDRIRLAKTAREKALTLNIDSIQLKANWNLSRTYLNYDLLDEFGDINKTNLKVATRLNDSTYIAYTNQNLGYFYDQKYMPDSSYYYYFKAVEFYEQLGDIRNRGEVLFNMASVRLSQRDYVGAEKNAIEALKLIQTLPKNDNNLDTIYLLYNQLAIIANRLGNYENSIAYHEQALTTGEQISDNLYYKLNSSNNLGYAYQRKKDYSQALKIYNEVLNQENLLEFDPELYVIVLGNIAFSNYLSGSADSKTIRSQFQKAYTISDSLEMRFGKMAIGNDIAEFYLSQNLRDSSEYFVKETLSLAREAEANEYILRSLKLLAELKPGDEGKKYLQEHIQLSDSLLVSERKFRDKFARIDFETDQIRAEKDKATRERLIFMISSIALLVTLFMLYIIITQRIKNKELAFAQQQQEANEEIYNLMLAQQDKIDEGRTQEKRRISEELHDGILGRLFGTRLSLDSLNLQNTDEAVKTRGQYIDELKSIEQEIRKISHDLNTDFISGRSFSDIIATLIETQTQAYQLTYDYQEDDEIDWDALPNKSKIHIYRMLQETMQNTYKHAQAKHLKISFELKNNVILLTVVDDGKGFNLNKARKGIGLKNFESRAKEIQGKVNIISQPGSGTEVQIEIPVQ